MIKIEGKMEDDIPTEPSELRSTILSSSGNIFGYLQTSSLIMGVKHFQKFYYLIFRLQFSQEPKVSKCLQFGLYFERPVPCNIPAFFQTSSLSLYFLKNNF